MNSKYAVHLFYVCSGKSYSEALTALACALPLVLTIPGVIIYVHKAPNFQLSWLSYSQALVEDCVLTVLHCTSLLNLCTERDFLYLTAF